MNAIELMIQEHTYIKRMLVVLRAFAYKVLEKEIIDFQDFYDIIDFVRNYADKHHHGKEEQLLFDKMINVLGGPAEKLVKYGMLVEHDLGRLYIANLEKAVQVLQAGNEEARLDVIANAVGYTDLLTRHIEKEDTLVFPFAQNHLSEEWLQKLQKECNEFEQQAENLKTQQKYIEMLEKLENKAQPIS